ncbi:hypothetical protein DRP07_00260 [Archaeoglobales archaeon]|nr:MAG: hypothetical protein DRP07_00260 [Archaeoglobales archaeon]
MKWWKGKSETKAEKEPCVCIPKKDLERLEDELWDLYGDVEYLEEERYDILQKILRIQEMLNRLPRCEE